MNRLVIVVISMILLQGTAEAFLSQDKISELTVPENCKMCLSDHEKEIYSTEENCLLDKINKDLKSISVAVTSCASEVASKIEDLCKKVCIK